MKGCAMSALTEGYACKKCDWCLEESDFEHPLYSFKIDDSRDAPLSKGCALNEGMCPNKEMCPDKGM